MRQRLLRLPILCVSIEPPTEETSSLEAIDHVMKPFRRSTLEHALERALIQAVPGRNRCTGILSGGRILAGRTWRQTRQKSGRREESSPVHTA